MCGVNDEGDDDNDYADDEYHYSHYYYIFSGCPVLLEILDLQSLL